MIEGVSVYHLILRIVLASVLGGIIGLEREYRAKEAGFRTHFLVAMGASLFMVVSAFGFEDVLGRTAIVLDPSRIAAQIVTGIGFIGAGSIIFQKHVVRGLTTAAGLWATAAIGMAMGAGLFLLAIVATVLVLVALEAFNKIIAKIALQDVMMTFVTDGMDKVKGVIKILNEQHIQVSTYRMVHEGQDYVVTLELRMNSNLYKRHFPNFIAHFEGVDIRKIE